jgi:hypothetical protein
VSRRRTTAEVVVILWRDIPAQINGKDGELRHQIVLPRRFQRAIDRAAMVADKKTAQQYVGEWRRISHPLVGELIESVEATAASIEAEFGNDRLHVLVSHGGWDPASPEPHPDQAGDQPPDQHPDRPGAPDPGEPTASEEPA